MTQQHNAHEWNQSYNNKDNFVFYPQNEIIRFLSTHVRKRQDLNTFIDHVSMTPPPNILDIGCGIGRHMKLIDDFGCNAYGFDLSEVAVQTAKQDFANTGRHHLIDNVIVADITQLPYPNHHFDFSLSHGVLDSMPFDIASTGLKELHRCMAPKGLMYMDLISTEDSSFTDGVYEKTVHTQLEKNTIQSYYDLDRIHTMITPLFTIKHSALHTTFNHQTQTQLARFHLILENQP